MLMTEKILCVISNIKHKEKKDGKQHITHPWLK